MPRDLSRFATLGYQTGDTVRPLIGDTARRGRVVARTGNGRRRQFRVRWQDGTTSWLWETDLTLAEDAQ